jgi:hypothetical protein
VADLTTAALDVMLNALRGVAVFASLHSADPTTVGDHELAGGSPAYARKGITWAGSAGGLLDTSAVITFDIPAGTTVGWVGLWSAATAGTFYGAALMAVPETWGAQGKMRVLTGAAALG